MLKKSEIVPKYGLLNRTLSTILENHEKIEAAYDVSQFGQRIQNTNLTGAVLQEKVKAFDDALSDSNFTCSNKWLTKFKVYHRAVCKRICTEKSTVDENCIVFFS